MLLTGRGTGFKLNGAKVEKEQTVLEIIRYAIGELLGWTPQYAMTHLTYQVVEKMQLDRLMQYIDFPDGMSPKTDIEYVLSLAYPELPFDLKMHTHKLHEQVMSGQIKKYPTHFFRGHLGYQRANILLREMIASQYPNASADELYRLFASKKIMSVLRKQKLDKPCTSSKKGAQQIYETPLDYLHYALPEDGSTDADAANLPKRDPFLYAFLQFRIAYSECLQDMKPETQK